MVQMLIRPPAALKEILQSESQRMGLTLNSLVLQILWSWVKDNSDSVELPDNYQSQRRRRAVNQSENQCTLYTEN